MRVRATCMCVAFTWSSHDACIAVHEVPVHVWPRAHMQPVVPLPARSQLEPRAPTGRSLQPSASDWTWTSRALCFLLSSGFAIQPSAREVCAAAGVWGAGPDACLHQSCIPPRCTCSLHSSTGSTCTHCSPAHTKPYPYLSRGQYVLFLLCASEVVRQYWESHQPSQGSGEGCCRERGCGSTGSCLTGRAGGL